MECSVSFQVRTHILPSTNNLKQKHGLTDVLRHMVNCSMKIEREKGSIMEKKWHFNALQLSRKFQSILGQVTPGCDDTRTEMRLLKHKGLKRSLTMTFTSQKARVHRSKVVPVAMATTEQEPLASSSGRVVKVARMGATTRTTVCWQLAKG